MMSGTSPHLNVNNGTSSHETSPHRNISSLFLMDKLGPETLDQQSWTSGILLYLGGHLIMPMIQTCVKHNITQKDNES